jgi:hypothetical protein
MSDEAPYMFIRPDGDNRDFYCRCCGYYKRNLPPSEAHALMYSHVCRFDEVDGCGWGLGR